MIRPLQLICLCAAVTALAGCAGYQLGPTAGTANAGKSVQINPFANHTLEPRLTDAVSVALRRQLQRDGTVRLATRDDADIVVTGVITRYTRDQLSLLPTDVLTASDYRVNLTAQVTAREAGSGRVLFDKAVSGYTLIRVGSDLTSAERQGIPLLADDLAKNVLTLLVNGDW